MGGKLTVHASAPTPTHAPFVNHPCADAVGGSANRSLPNAATLDPDVVVCDAIAPSAAAARFCPVDEKTMICVARVGRGVGGR